jgi:ABC-type antimicrobial peptide transport system permease subunit
MGVLRSLLAVILGVAIAGAGLVLCSIVANAILMKVKQGIVVEAPTGFWLATVGYGFIMALLGGLAAGWIGRRRPAGHGAMVGVVLVGLTYWSMAGATGDEPTWFSPPSWFLTGAMLMVLLGGLAGGWLRGRLRQAGRIAL